ncbi:hypothetical protein GCM10009792_17520 [Microcella alkalica]|uniref:SbsA Ig-like domain-containing protein n=1 Tax=Microcella alkalica TaxID=355930 RepID=A0A839E6X7_9MICO|nr:hypothetical protein [Microcella alkalica]MBA8847540.1 hypothetical protein [Microcella alkalica]
MSPTSSEHTRVEERFPGVARAADHGRRLREERDQRRFARAFAALVGILVGLGLIFLALGTLQGPKLSSAQVDPARVTEQTGQQLRLFANQPVDALDASVVTVEPAATTSVSVQGELIVVQFEERLRYGTEYTVRVEGVGAPSRPNTSTFEHRFTTSPASVLYLDRDDSGVDEILRADIDGAGRGEVVHAAQGIQHMAPIERVIVVARDDGAGGSVLESVDARSGRIERLALPDGVRVDRLIAPRAGTTIALVLSPASAAVEGESGGEASAAATEGAVAPRSLALLDIGGDRALQPLAGLDGEPLTALGAWFLPAGGLLVHTVDETLVQVDPAAPETVLPIGAYPTVHGISSDGTRVSAADSFGGVALDLATGEEERINPSLVEGEVAFGGEAALTASGLRVQKVAVADAATGAFATVLVADDGGGVARLLARTIENRGSLGPVLLSPNDQYVVVEVTPDVEAAVSDGRPIEARPTSITLAIIDVESGRLLRTLEGFAPVWTTG